MKIAFLTPEYPSDKTGNSGGIGTSIKNLAQSLTALGHKVNILVYGQNADAVFNIGDITITQIKNVKLKGLSWYFTRKKIQSIINDLHDRKELDIVEAPDWTGITSFVKPKKCPIVIKLHGSDTYFCNLDQRPVKWINRFHEKRALKNANGHISVSQYTANKTNELFGLNIPFSVIPNGINCSDFKPSKFDSNSLTILYFGTLIRKKGLLELPHIFNKINEKLPNAKLLLVGKDANDIQTGNSSTWELMKEIFTEAALKQVDYKGIVPYEFVRAQIDQAKVCVFPTFAEALPVSWLEAMAMEKAVVASNIGWGPEVIKNNHDGILVFPKDHQMYAEAVLELLENNILNATFGQNARIKVQQNFSNDLIAKKNAAFYQSIIDKYNA